MFLLCLCVDAAAQTPLPGRIEIGGGILWIGAQTLGSGDANETTPAGTARPLFSATSTLASAPSAEGRVAVRMTRALELEATATYARPELRIELGSDVENAAPVTARETIQQFTVGGGVNWYFQRRRASKLYPFVGGGAGYLRQLHAGATLGQTGEFYQAGGGVKVLLTSRVRKHLKGAGVRADARAFIRSKGVAFDRRGTSLALGLSLFVRL